MFVSFLFFVLHSIQSTLIKTEKNKLTHMNAFYELEVLRVCNYNFGCSGQ